MSDENISVPTIEPGRYEHYKGKPYEVLGVALHSETLEPLVVYKPLYDSVSEYWVRPYDMFLETVEVDGLVVPRFKKAS